MKVKNYFNIFLFELIFYIFDTNTVLQSFIPISALGADNVIHLLMQFVEFGILFFLCLRMTGLKIEGKKLLKAAVVILPIKFVLDIVSYYVTIRSEFLSVEAVFNKFIWDIFHILCIVLMFAVIAAVWKPQKSENKKSLKINIVLLSIGVACFIVSGVLLSDFIGGTVYKYDIDRIISSHEYTLENLPDMQTNLEYYINGASEIYGIVSVFIRTLIFASVSNIFGAIYAADEQVVKRRFGVDIGCIFVCFILNLCFNNANAFTGIYHGKAVFEKEPSVMTVDYDVWQLLRGFGKGRHIWCACDVNYVYLGDEYVCKFRTYPLASSEWFVDYGDADCTTIVCENTLIAYKNENGQWENVKFKYLGEAKENEKLTGILKNVCKTGNLEAINYALPYFDKYDSEYIIEIPREGRNENEFLSEEYSAELFDKIRYKTVWLQ